MVTGSSHQTLICTVRGTIGGDALCSEIRLDSRRLRLLFLRREPVEPVARLGLWAIGRRREQVFEEGAEGAHVRHGMYRLQVVVSGAVNPSGLCARAGGRAASERRERVMAAAGLERTGSG